MPRSQRSAPSVRSCCLWQAHSGPSAPAAQPQAGAQAPGEAWRSLERWGGPGPRVRSVLRSAQAQSKSQTAYDSSQQHLCVGN